MQYIFATWLLVMNLGSEDYKTRMDAQQNLMVMPWAEPVLKANMGANLELTLRGRQLIKYWHQQPPGPQPGYYYVRIGSVTYFGLIKDRTKGDIATFWWGDGVGLRRMEVRWRQTRFYEDPEVLAYYEN